MLECNKSQSSSVDEGWSLKLGLSPQHSPYAYYDTNHTGPHSLQLPTAAYPALSQLTPLPSNQADLQPDQQP